MSYSHSCKPDIPITHSSHLSMWLSMLFSFFPPPLKPHCQVGFMGSVGDGCNIAITTALPPQSFVYCNVNIK